MKKRLIIHIGYPKTATTSLQLNLFGDLMKDGKIEYLNHLGKDEDYLGKVSCVKIIQNIISGKDFSPHELKKEFQSLKRIKKRTSIISAETISTISPKSSFSSVNSDGKNNAYKFHSTFKNYFDNIEVIIGIRSQRTMLQACYKQWYHLIVGEQPKFQNPELWIQSNFQQNLSDNNLLFNYNELIQTYQTAFGSDKVHVLIYEELLYNKDQYYNKLANIVNVQKTYVANSLEKNIQNKTLYTDRGLVIIPGFTIGQKISKPFRFLIKEYFGQNLFNSLKLTYHKIFPNWILNKTITKELRIEPFTDDQINFIYKRFEHSNKSLIDTAELDKDKLIEYGYL